MAGLIGLTADDMVIQDALSAKEWRFGMEWIPRPVCRLTTTLPVGVLDETLDDIVVEPARWGFPVGPRTVGNARDDKLQTSPMWSAMLGRSHCLVATSGIYEMVRDGDEKTSYWFRRRDQKPIVMPGLISERTVKGEQKTCVAIVTTEPNEFFGQYHGRQVCNLLPGEEEQWLRADETAAMKLLKPASPEDWEVVPVDNRIFAPGRREMEDLVEVGAPVQFEK